MVDLCDADLYAVNAEANRAEVRYGSFRSTHEALGVLMEEVHELIEAIRSNDLKSCSVEAKQVSAVAFRLMRACNNANDGVDPSFRSRSGC